MVTKKALHKGFRSYIYHHGNVRISIVSGNSKLGTLPNISLTPIKACGNCRACKDTCYAMKAYKMYPEVRNAWNENLRSAKSNPVVYFATIDVYISKHSPRFFRWHVAGDILNQAYYNEMADIAERHPETTFLAFTKMYKLDYSRRPGNLTIILSAWPGVELPETDLPIAYMQDGTETRVNNAIECPGNCETCGMCFNLPAIGKNVVFNLH